MSKTLIESILGDTGDLGKWSEDKLEPGDLIKLAEEPASVLWVVRFIRRVQSGCWVGRWVRNFRMWLAIGLGGLAAALVAFNIIGYFALHSMIRESQRETVIQTLKELRIISADTPDPATGESVVIVQGGSL